MLDFFRRYQRYFFLVITFVVIISFSFFGTYSTLGSNTWHEQIAFKAVNGRDVMRSEVDEMALFLSTDGEDKIFYGGVWGANFLNDGVIRKDFLEDGLAQELALAYKDDLRDDINKRLIKEKKYKLYSHPQAPFLSVENVWSYFAPEMTSYFNSLQAAQDGLDAEAFNNRIKLYLAARKIPASTLQYVLRYQEKQYPWLNPDDRLNQADLSLFGYHTLEDWFGPHFIRLVSEFIINTAILAEKQGYEVSKAEVLADLIHHTQTSYQQNQNNPYLGVTSAEEYLNEQLRRLNLDHAGAIKIWRQVLLFRRYFQDIGSNALVDAFMSQKLHQFAYENVNVDLYRLPSSLRLANYDDLQKLEVYLYATTKQVKTDPLALPQQFLEVSEVIKKYPELVQKRYVLDVTQINQKTLQTRIGLRELWNWEVNDANWPMLTQQFPSLKINSGKTHEDRFEALDSLDPTARSIVDAFAKEAIVKAHPEWIHQALNNTKAEKMVVGLRIQGGKMPFSGLEEKETRRSFIRLLDEAPISENVESNSVLYDFSADQQVYYRIAVLDRAKSEEILTFAESRSDGTLDKLRDKLLEKYYINIRGKDSSFYKNENKEWKSFKEVKDAVADQYFGKVLKALDSINKNLKVGQEVELLSKDQVASLRFYSYLKKIKEELERNPSQANQWIKEQTEEQPISLVRPSILEDQWKIDKTTLTLNRQSSENVVNIKEALALTISSWSAIHTPITGDLTFYQVKDYQEASFQPTLIAEQVRQLQNLLGAEAQRHFIRQIIMELKNQNAISLAYLKIPTDEIPAQGSTSP